MTTDETMKAQVSLGFAVPANLIFGMVQLYSAILNSSFWFYTLSIYYILLAVMRAILLRYAQQYRLGDNIVSESKVYRFSGIMLMVMNLAVTTIVSCIVRLDMGFTHPPVITVFIAMGTFFCVFVTIRNLVRYHDYKTPVMSAAKVISFVAAMMSFLSLETAMLASFGARFSMTFKRGITAVTGGLVCLAVLATSVYMIVRSTKYIRSA